MTSNECPCCTRKTQLGEAKGDRFYCEHCKVFFGSIKDGIYYPDGDWELPSTSDKPVKCMISRGG